MDIVTADNISKKVKALKHCDKLISKINKNGSTVVKLNCTGVEFVVNKGDAIYLSLLKTRNNLYCDIGLYEVNKKATAINSTISTSPKLA